MSYKNGQQLTLPAMLKRKRLADDSNDESPRNAAPQPKRRYLQPKNEPDNVQLRPEPDSPKNRRLPLDDASRTLSRFREITCASHLTNRPSPLPKISWADSSLLWQSMIAPDLRSRQSRSADMFLKNPEVQPKMRSILLDWLIEVAEVYKLHRETYYLAQDYVDRVLFSSKDTPKSELQLLGITCLFIASKVEEIYPPKVNEFAYVTDGACTEKAIVDHEIYVLQTLEWDLCPLTPAGWLRLYLQIACQQIDNNGENMMHFEMPRFPAKSLPMVSRLLDLATLDSGCMAFSYAELAAASFALIYGRECSIKASGFKWVQLKACVAWMARFAITLHTEGLVIIAGAEKIGEDAEDVPVRPELKFSSSIHIENEHNLQSHIITLQMLDLAQKSFDPNFEQELTGARPEEPSSPVNHLKTPSNKLSKHPEDAESLEKAPVKSTTASKLNTQNLNPKELFLSQE